MNKHKDFGGPRKQPSIDGITSGNRELGLPAGRQGHQVHRSYQPNRESETPSLGDSSHKADGFHPMRTGADQPLGADSDYMDHLDQPIMLDQPPEKESKKRRKLLKKQTRHHSRRRKYIKRALTLVAIVIVAALGALAYKFYDTQRQILAGGGRAPAVCNGDVDVAQLEREGDGRVNILLVGIGGPEHSDGPNLTDTIMLTSLDPVNDKADLVSIPRDLWVRVPGDGSSKVNATYFYGLESSNSKDPHQQQRDGLSRLDRTLQPVVGLPIHYHILVDFAAFRETVNAIGGIDVYVPKELAVSERLWDEATGKNYFLNVPAGQQHFDGTKALFFARSRKTSPRGDFDRAERQRLMLVALQDKILSIGTFSNPVKVVQLLDTLGENIYTDFDTESLKCLYDQISQVQAANIKSLDMATPPNDLLATANLSGTSIVRPKAGLFEYDALQAFLRTSLRDSFLAKENASVAVYNATSTDGLATEQADLLRSYGYNVTIVDSAPSLTNPTKTTVVDLSSGADRYTRNYLERRYGVAAVEKIPADTGIAVPQGTKFVIILGHDAEAS
ncbi:hypothetical protein A3E49_01230 [Candidatus Saccharibacteria bacterium RIFCSPHIGHO2_12_FULL_49_19]|nr:MAG: hypothetical protein A3E49_01230 [Candidatus Saccharibacteria bacterium RIFCSPHIGHO2_12_FULL_49_19]